MIDPWVRILTMTGWFIDNYHSYAHISTQLIFFFYYFLKQSLPSFFSFFLSFKWIYSLIFTAYKIILSAALKSIFIPFCRLIFNFYLSIIHYQSTADSRILPCSCGYPKWLDTVRFYARRGRTIKSYRTAR